MRFFNYVPIIFFFWLFFDTNHLGAGPFKKKKEKVNIMRVGVKRINQAIEGKLIEQNLNYNTKLNDFLFARRVFVDLTGTIPTYEELVTFVND